MTKLKKNIIKIILYENIKFLKISKYIILE